MWRFQAMNVKPIHYSKCAQQSVDPSGYFKDLHVTGLIEESSYNMSEQDYNYLNEIISYLTNKPRSCRKVVKKAIQEFTSDLIHYRDLTKKTIVRPPENEEDRLIIDRMRIGIEKNRISN